MRYVFYSVFLLSIAAFFPSAEGDDTENTPKPDDKNAIAALQRFGTRTQDNEEGNVLAFRFHKQPTAEAIESLKGLPFLEGVGLQDSATSGADLVFLKELPNLKSLWLDNDQLDKEGISHVRQLPSLEKLFLMGEGINDATLARLGDFPNLTFLQLSNTRVTEDGLNRLGNLKNL